MRVNVDDVAFMDRRFKLLGGRLGMTWQEALGRCLPVWALAYQRRSAVLPAGDVDALAERAGFAAAMVEVGLAVTEGDEVYLCGVTERIDFLLIQDAKREKARAARLSAAGVQSPPGRPRGKQPIPPAVSPGTVPGGLPGEGPYSPDLTPDLALAPERARARSIFGAGLSPAELLRLRAIGDLAEATWKRVSDARMERARAIKLEGVIPLPSISPGHVPAAFNELRERIREEGDNARKVCDHVVQALVEQSLEDKTEKSLEWLSEKAFTPGAWRTARNRVLKPKRKPAAQRDREDAPQMSELSVEDRLALNELSMRTLYGRERAPPRSASATTDDTDDEQPDTEAEA